MTVRCAQCAHYVESFFWCTVKRSVRPHEDVCPQAMPKCIRDRQEREKEQNSVNLEVFK